MSAISQQSQAKRGNISGYSGETTLTSSAGKNTGGERSPTQGEANVKAAVLRLLTLPVGGTRIWALSRLTECGYDEQAAKQANTLLTAITQEAYKRSPNIVSILGENGFYKGEWDGPMGGRFIVTGALSKQQAKLALAWAMVHAEAKSQTERRGSAEPSKCFFCQMENPDHPGHLCPLKPNNGEMRRCRGCGMDNPDHLGRDCPVKLRQKEDARQLQEQSEGLLGIAGVPPSKLPAAYQPNLLPTNYVGQLKEYWEANFKGQAPPQYRSWKAGPDHDPLWHASVTTSDGKSIVSGHATKTAREAEQVAAKAWLSRYSKVSDIDHTLLPMLDLTTESTLICRDSAVDNAINAKMVEFKRSVLEAYGSKVREITEILEDVGPKTRRQILLALLEADNNIIGNCNGFDRVPVPSSEFESPEYFALVLMELRGRFPSLATYHVNNVDRRMFLLRGDDFMYIPTMPTTTRTSEELAAYYDDEHDISDDEYYYGLGRTPPLYRSELDSDDDVPELVHQSDDSASDPDEYHSTSEDDVPTVPASLASELVFHSVSRLWDASPVLWFDLQAVAVREAEARVHNCNQHALNGNWQVVRTYAFRIHDTDTTPGAYTIRQESISIIDGSRDRSQNGWHIGPDTLAWFRLRIRIVEFNNGVVGNEAEQTGCYCAWGIVESTSSVPPSPSGLPVLASQMVVVSNITNVHNVSWGTLTAPADSAYWGILIAGDMSIVSRQSSIFEYERVFHSGSDFMGDAGSEAQWSLHLVHSTAAVRGHFYVVFTLDMEIDDTDSTDEKLSAKMHNRSMHASQGNTRREPLGVSMAAQIARNIGVAMLDRGETREVTIAKLIQMPGYQNLDFDALLPVSSTPNKPPVHVEVVQTFYPPQESLPPQDFTETSSWDSVSDVDDTLDAQECFQRLISATHHPSMQIFGMGKICREFLQHPPSELFPNNPFWMLSPPPEVVNENGDENDDVVHSKGKNNPTGKGAGKKGGNGLPTIPSRHGADKTMVKPRSGINDDPVMDKKVKAVHVVKRLRSRVQKLRGRELITLAISFIKGKMSKQFFMAVMEGNFDWEEFYDMAHAFDPAEQVFAFMGVAYGGEVLSLAMDWRGAGYSEVKAAGWARACHALTGNTRPRPLPVCDECVVVMYDQVMRVERSKRIARNVNIASTLLLVLIVTGFMVYLALLHNRLMHALNGNTSATSEIYDPFFKLETPPITVELSDAGDPLLKLNRLKTTFGGLRYGTTRVGKLENVISGTTVDPKAEVDQKQTQNFGFTYVVPLTWPRRGGLAPRVNPHRRRAATILAEDMRQSVPSPTPQFIDILTRTANINMPQQVIWNRHDAQTHNGYLLSDRIYMISEQIDEGLCMDAWTFRMAVIGRTLQMAQPGTDWALSGDKLTTLIPQINLAAFGSTDRTAVIDPDGITPPRWWHPGVAAGQAFFESCTSDGEVPEFFPYGSQNDAVQEFVLVPSILEAERGKTAIYMPIAVQTSRDFAYFIMLLIDSPFALAHFFVPFKVTDDDGDVVNQNVYYRLNWDDLVQPGIKDKITFICRYNNHRFDRDEQDELDLHATFRFHHGGFGPRAHEVLHYSSRTVNNPYSILGYLRSLQESYTYDSYMSFVARMLAGMPQASESYHRMDLLVARLSNRFPLGEAQVNHIDANEEVTRSDTNRAWYYAHTPRDAHDPDYDDPDSWWIDTGYVHGMSHSWRNADVDGGNGDGNYPSPIYPEVTVAVIGKFSVKAWNQWVLGMTHYPGMNTLATNLHYMDRFLRDEAYTMALAMTYQMFWRENALPSSLLDEFVAMVGSDVVLEPFFRSLFTQIENKILIQPNNIQHLVDIASKLVGVRLTTTDFEDMLMPATRNGTGGLDQTGWVWGHETSAQAHHPLEGHRLDIPPCQYYPDDVLAAYIGKGSQLIGAIPIPGPRRPVSIDPSDNGVEIDRPGFEDDVFVQVGLYRNYVLGATAMAKHEHAYTAALYSRMALGGAHLAPWTVAPLHPFTLRWTQVAGNGNTLVDHVVQGVTWHIPYLTVAVNDAGIVTSGGQFATMRAAAHPLSGYYTTAENASVTAKFAIPEFVNGAYKRGVELRCYEATDAQDDFLAGRVSLRKWYPGAGRVESRFAQLGGPSGRFVTKREAKPRVEEMMPVGYRSPIALEGGVFSANGQPIAGKAPVNPVDMVPPAMPAVQRDPAGPPGSGGAHPGPAHPSG